MPPKVTVVTPTYNRRDLIEETVEAIIGQSFGDFEYIVIDDGSTDGTEQALDRYRSRIQYHWQENRGEAAAVNRGWGLARGEYVAVVSSDDPMLPIWLERMVAFMDAHPEIVVAYPDWQAIDGSSRVLYPLRLPEFSYEHMVAWSHCMPGPGALIRRGAVADEPYLRNPRYRYVSDLEAWMRLGLRGPFARVPEVLANWRLHEGAASIAVKSRLRAREHIDLMTEYFSRPDLPAPIARHRSAAMARAYFLAAQVVRETMPALAVAYYLRSVLASPFEPPGLPDALNRRHFRVLGRIYTMMFGTAR